MKKKFRLLIICSITGMLQCLGMAMDPPADPNLRDLQLLAQWFEGEFDNDEQLWVENRSDWQGNPEEKHDRVHAMHKKVTADSIGNYIFYVEEFINDDPNKISRQRLISFESAVDTLGIIMKIYFLKDTAKYALGASSHQQAISNISKNDLFGLDGCDVIFQRVGDQFHGSMKDRACQFGKGDELRYSVHNLIISKEQYWRVDRTFLVKDNSFWKGHPNNEPHKMRRVNFYTCDVSFYEKAYYLPSEKDRKYDGLRVHDQGGTAVVENPIDGKTYFIQLRNKQYPFYPLEDSNFFFLRFKEQGAKASTALAFGEPMAKTIGFQMNWASAVCKCEE